MAAVLAVAPLAGAAIPKEVVKIMELQLPAAFSPLPAASGNKIFPCYSETRTSLDRTSAVTFGEEPFAITAVSKDGKSVEMSVPKPQRAAKGKAKGKDGKDVADAEQTKEYVKRWFRADDVFGRVKWKLERYEAKCQHLAYFFCGKRIVDIAGMIEEGTQCDSLGTVMVGNAKYMLLYAVAEQKAGGEDNAFEIVLAREAPPVKTVAEYNKRAAELFSEYAYRTGRPWGKMHPALLTHEGCYECAGMASDFAKYMFGTGLSKGELFKDASEIRSGDTVYMKSHYFAVVFRNGEQLHTIEGNMNAIVCQSKTRYSVRNGKLYCGKEERVFERGWHHWQPEGACDKDSQQQKGKQNAQDKDKE